MKEIVKTLLMEGVDEDTIHRVLDVISEKLPPVNYKNFNSMSTPDDIRELQSTVQKQIDADNAKIAKKPNKAAEKRIKRNQEYMREYKRFLDSGKQHPNDPD